MTIGERLKMLRKEHELTQNELSKELNLGQTTIAAYENGTHEPNLFGLKAYADFFDCSIDYLVGREDDDSEFNYKVESGIIQPRIAGSKTSGNEISSTRTGLYISEKIDLNKDKMNMISIPEANLPGKSKVAAKGRKVTNKRFKVDPSVKEYIRLNNIIDTLSKNPKLNTLEGKLLSIFYDLNDSLKEILVKQASVLHSSDINTSDRKST